MKKHTLLTALLTTSLVFSGTALAAGGYGHGQGKGKNRMQDQSVQSSITTVESDDMKYMREEEKLARDVYLTLDQYWG